MSMVKDFTDENFKKDVQENTGVVLIEFWAPWCGPCKMQGPIVDELAEKYKDNKELTIGKMNVDENPTTAQAFQVMSIPTLKIFKAGKIVSDMIGLQSKETLDQAITESLT